MNCTGFYTNFIIILFQLQPDWINTGPGGKINMFISYNAFCENDFGTM
jgi:hypothetical protein